MAYVRHVTDYLHWRDGEVIFRAFLVAEGGTGYLVNYDAERRTFSYLCPCCMLAGHHCAIKDAVEKAIQEGVVSGKVRWCCHESDAPYGDNIGFPGLGQNSLWCSGNAHEISEEAKAQLHQVALNSPKSVPLDDGPVLRAYRDDRGITIYPA